MKLRTQMLLACALTLLVPIVGWHSAKQLYATLQQTRIDEQSLKVLNLRVAIDESEELDSLFKGMQRRRVIQFLSMGIATIGEI